MFEAYSSLYELQQELEVLKLHQLAGSPSGVLVVALCGNIGAGKSTLLSGLVNLLNKAKLAKLPLKVHTVPEYLDDPETGKEGHRKLQQWLKGEISSREFEEYILQHYRRKLNKIYKEIKLSTAQSSTKHYVKHVIIFERLPAEITQVFLPQEDCCWFDIQQKVWELECDFDLPTLPTTASPMGSSASAQSVIIDTNKLSSREVLNKVYSLVKQALSRGELGESKALVVYLRADTDKLLGRIKKRNRKGEGSYTRDYIQQLQDKYDSLFCNMSHDLSCARRGE